MVENEEVCLGRLINLTGTKCRLDLIFNGARSIKSVFYEIAEPAYIKENTVFDEGIGYNVVTQEQVGEGGLKPFIDQAYKAYPNVQLIPDNIFQQMVDAQKQAAEDLIGDDGK